jgi:hypothetical protein
MISRYATLVRRWSNHLQGQSFFAKMGGSFAYAPVSLIPKPLLLLNRGTAFRYNLITFVQADWYNLNFIQQAVRCFRSVGNGEFYK